MKHIITVYCCRSVERENRGYRNHRCTKIACLFISNKHCVYVYTNAFGGNYA